MQEIALEISPSALPSWRLLPHCVRWHVGASLGGPDSMRLSVAFPRMIRRVTDVIISESITVWLQCEGRHEGMWADVICPTRRRVTFWEQHEIVAADGCVLSDRVTRDLEGILTQLCRSGGIDPDETARLGRVRRDWQVYEPS